MYPVFKHAGALVFLPFLEEREFIIILGVLFMGEGHTTLRSVILKFAPFGSGSPLRNSSGGQTRSSSNVLTLDT